MGCNCIGCECCEKKRKQQSTMVCIVCRHLTNSQLKSRVRRKSDDWADFIVMNWRNYWFKKWKKKMKFDFDQFMRKWQYWNANWSVLSIHLNNCVRWCLLALSIQVKWNGKGTLSDSLSINIRHHSLKTWINKQKHLWLTTFLSSIGATSFELWFTFDGVYSKLRSNMYSHLPYM